MLPASFGGAGFRERNSSHSDEVAAGGLWGRCGCASEVAPLSDVLLAWPGEELRVAGSPDDYLLLRPVDVAALQDQALKVAAFYEAHGVRAHVFRPPRPCPPNLIFMRDLFFMTPEGALLARMASEQRAGEERFAALALAELGVPILASPREHAVFEGADALWLDRTTVLIGIGRRTNRAGYQHISRLLSNLGVTSIPVKVPRRAQHLLGALVLLDEDLAAVLVDEDTDELRELLRARRIQSIEFTPEYEISEARAMNVVTLSPRRIVMPAGCPRTRQRFEMFGVECSELDVGEYVNAAGALGCLTGILRRG